jgi:hypothetical protein
MTSNMAAVSAKEWWMPAYVVEHRRTGAVAGQGMTAEAAEGDAWARAGIRPDAYWRTVPYRDGALRRLIAA